MNVNKQIENPNQKTDKSIYDPRKDLLNVDISRIKPVNAKIHPEWESLLRLSQLRITEELGPGFELSKDISEWSLYSYPSLNVDYIASILIFNMVAFALDDYFDKYPTESEKIIQKLRNKNFPGNEKMDKWCQLAVKVCQEAMGEIASTQFLDIYIVSISKAVEVSRIISGLAPLSDKDFLELRCIDAGAPPQFFPLLTGVGKQLTAELSQDPNYLGFNKQVAIQTVLINDLYSLRKEIRDGNYRFNYVYVKMTNNKMSAQAAVDDIIREICEAERMARVYGDRIKAMNDPQLVRYVDGMYELMDGNHHWSTFCKRYNDL